MEDAIKEIQSIIDCEIKHPINDGHYLKIADNLNKLFKYVQENNDSKDKIDELETALSRKDVDICRLNDELDSIYYHMEQKIIKFTEAPTEAIIPVLEALQNSHSIRLFNLLSNFIFRCDRMLQLLHILGVTKVYTESKVYLKPRDCMNTNIVRNIVTKCLRFDYKNVQHEWFNVCFYLVDWVFIFWNNNLVINYVLTHKSIPLRILFDEIGIMNIFYNTSISTLLSQLDKIQNHREIEYYMISNLKSELLYDKWFDGRDLDKTNDSGMRRLISNIAHLTNGLVVDKIIWQRLKLAENTPIRKYWEQRGINAKLFEFCSYELRQHIKTCRYDIVRQVYPHLFY